MKRLGCFVAMAAVFAATAVMAAPEGAVSGEVSTPSVRRGRHGGKHVFPEWTPTAGAPAKVAETELEADIRALVAQGRRDHAASPEFLAALEGVLAKHKWDRVAEEVPTSRLPMTPCWRSGVWPAGWDAIRRDVWQFGDGQARQVQSQANTRYVLFYEPGMEWTDYEMTVRFESDSWFTPPARSGAFIYFRYHGVDDTYVMVVDGAGDLTLSSEEKDRHAPGRVLAQVLIPPETVRDGKPWTVKVRGEKIEVWHEGKRMLFCTDRAHTSGTIGVEGVHIPMRFDGIEVR
ncbi:MAG: hypothetical protein ILO10_04770 [Kiritimatiellae bacterium]|nr:hypothetical protein [Kiritimatiellia bacterium]